MLINHSICKMNAGSLVIIPPGEIHKSSYGSNEKVKQERAVIRFSVEDIDWICGMLGGDRVLKGLDAGIMRIPEKRQDYVESLISRIIYETQMPDDMSVGVVKTLFQELVIFLLRCREYGENAAHELDAENSIIQDVATYIYNNYNKPVYLSEVADMFHISKSYLSKKFKATTGFGFKEYLLNIRIKEACRLLLETDMSIMDIAFACGFNDSNYFGDAFRKIKGISPNKYRHHHEAV